MRRPSNAICAVLGTGVWSAANFFMNSAITKGGTQGEVAVYILAAAIATPICDFAFLSLRGLQNSDGKGEFSFGEYLSLRLLGILSSLLVLALWAGAQGGGFLPGMVLLFGLRVCVDAAIDMHHGLVQKLGRLDLASFSLGLRGVLGLVGFVVGLRLSGLTGAFVGQLLASCLLLLFLDRPTAKRVAASKEADSLGRVLADGLKPAFHWHDLHRLFVLALPLAVTTVIISLNSQVGRYFANAYLTQIALNTFGMVATLVALERLFINALGVASSTGLGETFAARDLPGFRRKANRLFIAAWGLTLGTGFLAAVVGRPLVSLIFRPEYARDPALIVIVMVAGGIACVASAQGYVLTALRVLRAQVPIYGVSLLILLATNWVLVPTLGGRGAAWAMLAGALTAVVGSHYYYVRALRNWS
ncbi:hypothetical protein EON81_03715 [bacterium]|nr:MAG: hypothetical protein EON81_03715 [bacterium]